MKLHDKDRDALCFPTFLADTYLLYERITVDIDNIRVRLISATTKRVVYVHVTETPHYIFARHIVAGDSLRDISGYSSYVEYSELDGNRCNEAKYVELISRMKTNGYDWVCNPILVYRRWSRFYPIHCWNVADGFHRLAILAAIGERNIKVVSLKNKHGLMMRIISRICKSI